MALSRKDFVLKITEGIQENPKAVLRGHGIQPMLLTKLVTRQDVVGKLATVAYSTMYAMRGTKALMKRPNFRIYAYKNFAEYNLKARQDVENFMAGLSEKDQELFQNKENIVAIMALPDNTESTGDTGTDIALGKSVMLPFESSVKKEYKIIGGFYFLVMFGDSAIRKAEATKANAKATMNERKVTISTKPARIKSKLVQKAKKKMSEINGRVKRLSTKRNIIGAELDEVNTYARQLGLGKQASPAQITSAERDFNRRTTAGAGALKAARIDVHEREINTIRMGNRNLVKKIGEATTAKERADLNFALRKRLQKIEQLKAKIGIYSDLSAKGIKNKAAMLSKLNAEIQENLDEGQTISQALQSALASLPVSQQVRQQLNQQVLSEVADGMDLQLAAQSAAQQAIQVAQVAQMVTPQQMSQAPKPRGRRKKVVDVPVEDFVDETIDESPNFSMLQTLKNKLSFV